MSDVKRLLDEATPLPWRVRRSIHGLKYRYVQIGKDESYTTLDLEPTDAALIVHAVNHLPDYEAAVDALERIRDHGHQPTYNGRPSCPFCGNFLDDEETHDSGCVSVVILRRLREGEAASV